MSLNVEGVGEEGAGGILWGCCGLERGIAGAESAARRRKRRRVARRSEREDAEGGRLGGGGGGGGVQWLRCWNTVTQ